MLTTEEAKRVVHGQSLGNRDMLLVMLSIQPIGPLSVQAIKNRCNASGLRKLAGKIFPTFCPIRAALSQEQRKGGNFNKGDKSVFAIWRTP